MNRHKRQEGGLPSNHSRPYLTSPYPYLELQQNHVAGRVKRCFSILARIFLVKGNHEFVWLIWETCLINIFLYWKAVRRNSQEKTATKFTGKRLFWRSATLLKERLRHRHFPVSFTKILKTHFLKNTSGDCLRIFKRN